MLSRSGLSPIERPIAGRAVAMIVESRLCMNIAQATISEMISWRVRGVTRAGLARAPRRRADPTRRVRYRAARREPRHRRLRSSLHHTEAGARCGKEPGAVPSNQYVLAMSRPNATITCGREFV